MRKRPRSFSENRAAVIRREDAYTTVVADAAHSNLRKLSAALGTDTHSLAYNIQRWDAEFVGLADSGPMSSIRASEIESARAIRAVRLSSTNYFASAAPSNDYEACVLMTAVVSVDTPCRLVVTLRDEETEGVRADPGGGGDANRPGKNLPDVSENKAVYRYWRKKRYAWMVTTHKASGDAPARGTACEDIYEADTEEEDRGSPAGDEGKAETKEGDGEPLPESLQSPHRDGIPPPPPLSTDGPGAVYVIYSASWSEALSREELSKEFGDSVASHPLFSSGRMEMRRLLVSEWQEAGEEFAKGRDEPHVAILGDSGIQEGGSMDTGEGTPDPTIAQPSADRAPLWDPEAHPPPLRTSTVWHLYYSGWRDGNLPRDGPNVLSLIHHVSDAVRPSGTWVHCFLGHGRTGTLVGYCLAADGWFGTEEAVIAMRESRCLAVQSFVQYRFLAWALMKRVACEIVAVVDLRKATAETTATDPRVGADGGTAALVPEERGVVRLIPDDPELADLLVRVLAAFPVSVVVRILRPRTPPEPAVPCHEHPLAASPLLLKKALVQRSVDKALRLANLLPTEILRAGVRLKVGAEVCTHTSTYSCGHDPDLRLPGSACWGMSNAGERIPTYVDHTQSRSSVNLAINLYIKDLEAPPSPLHYTFSGESISPDPFEGREEDLLAGLATFPVGRVACGTLWRWEGARKSPI